MILALDISTSITGFCVFNEYDNIHIGHIDLRKEKDFFKKVDIVRKKIEELHKQYEFKEVAIEEAFQSFGRGLSSAKTLFTLAKFNGIIQYIVFTLDLKTTVINVNNARKIPKKNVLLNIMLSRPLKSPFLAIQSAPITPPIPPVAINIPTPLSPACQASSAITTRIF